MRRSKLVQVRMRMRVVRDVEGGPRRSWALQALEPEDTQWAKVARFRWRVQAYSVYALIWAAERIIP